MRQTSEYRGSFTPRSRYVAYFRVRTALHKAGLELKAQQVAVQRSIELIIFPCSNIPLVLRQVLIA
jgi:hypothetical protein